MIYLKLVRRNIFIVTTLILSISSHAQVKISSEEALNKFNELQKKIEESFPQKEARTFKRESFSEVQLKTYLIQHFQQ